MAEDSTHASVRAYYGRVLQRTEDLKTSACTPASRPPPHISQALAKVREGRAALMRLKLVSRL